MASTTSTGLTVLEHTIQLARNYLRDFPKFFQVSFDTIGRTYELGQVNIDPDSIWVATVTSNVVTQLTTAQYSLDHRNGIMRLASTPAANTTIMIEGYYYEWVLPEDLQFYAERSINFHKPTIDIPLEQANQAVLDVIGLGALIEALQALMTEYARDIDVMTSESIHIPGSQRFRMLQSLCQQWEVEYHKHANNLNIGPERISQFSLRRISRTTNRYVPLYKGKEIGEYGPIERIFIEDTEGHILVTEADEPLREDVFIDGEPPTAYSSNAFY
jgi:hypothetical protein